MGLGNFHSFLPPKVVQAPAVGRIRSEGEGEGKNECEGDDESKGEVVMKVKAC